ncbi:MAG: phage antirepressor Ant [Ruminococcaceae bacterium]|jgi:phage anti-repressor protein|nr:phage antirepressor Ant [Oscillospiraceae bacterium]
MNDLTVFNSDVIPVYTTSTGEKVVVGRELHEQLKIKTDYKDWFPRMVAYGFTEGEDFSEIIEKVDAQNRARTYEQKNHILKLDMAKHISMIQRTPEGKAIRQKLIELETDISALSPELREMIHIETEQKRQAKAIEDVNHRVDSIGEVIALSPNSWRKDACSLIHKVAQKLGGNEYIRDVSAEVYKLVDERAGVSLSTRLTNKRRRMADEGVCKSKRDKLNKMDVIADDKKLIEIYVAVVKEMCIKNGVSLPEQMTA